MPLEEFTYSVIFRGVVLVFFSLKIFPRYQKAVGPVHACRVGLLGGMPCAVLVPAASLFSGSRIAQQVPPAICRQMVICASLAHHVCTAASCLPEAITARPLQRFRVRELGTG